MNKLYLIIYLAGHIGGSVGPLPYGFAECQQRARQQMASLDRTVTTSEGYSAADVFLACEWRHKRPALDPAAGKPKASNAVDANGNPAVRR